MGPCQGLLLGGSDCVGTRPAPHMRQPPTPSNVSHERARCGWTVGAAALPTLLLRNGRAQGPPLDALFTHALPTTLMKTDRPTHSTTSDGEHLKREHLGAGRSTCEKDERGGPVRVTHRTVHIPSKPS